MPSRLSYYRRIAAAYLTPCVSQLTFWHEPPEVNEHANRCELGQYYMTFHQKAMYAGQYDSSGIPMLDYHGKIGLQYNPIAIAQYGLGNLNLFLKTGQDSCRQKFLNVADWLLENLVPNRFGLSVWNHYFDWDYRDTLKAPWYSALAQGQGLSVLVRAFSETGQERYLQAAKRAFQVFSVTVDRGGVSYVDSEGNVWFEEYIVSPPTHILNGFIWATWGVYDYHLATHDQLANTLFQRSIQTLAANLKTYDVGYWSLYEQSGIRMKMLASPFYHSLHIIQLRILHALTGMEIFNHYAHTWDGYRQNPTKRLRALAHKSLFKLRYY